MKNAKIVHTAIENLETGILEGLCHGYENAHPDEGIMAYLH